MVKRMALRKSDQKMYEVVDMTMDEITIVNKNGDDMVCSRYDQYGDSKFTAFE